MMGVLLAMCTACSGGGLGVVTRTPGTGASNVWVRDPLTAVFSAPLAPSTVDDESVRVVTGDGVDLRRDVTLSSNGRVLTLRLLDQPPLPAQLRVALTSAITDVDGSPLVAPGAWSWTLPEWQRLGGVATPPQPWYPWPDMTVTGVGPVLAYVASDALRVRSWDGGAWRDLGDSPQRDAAAFVSRTWITADAGNAPVVVWTEESTLTWAHQLYASRWDGASWTPLGDALNVNPASSASWPTVADGPGHPVLLWRECALSCSRHVRAWDGAAWMPLGDAVTETGLARLALDASGHPYLVTSEYVDGDDLLHVDHWDGATWQRIGGAINAAVRATPYGLAIDVDGQGRPIVLWGEQGHGDTWATRAARWDGEDWVGLGGSLAVDPTAMPGQHDIAVDSAGREVAVWYEYGAGDAEPVSHLRAMRWDGEAWNALGAAVNDERADSVLPPALATWDEGQVLVAWTRSRGGADSVLDVVVGRYNELPPGMHDAP